MENLQSVERQQASLTPKQIVENFIFAAEPINSKKTLNEMFLGCLASDYEFSTSDRHQLLHLYNIMNGFIEDLENYKEQWNCKLFLDKELSNI
jgi:hypothetical protein